MKCVLEALPEQELLQHVIVPGSSRVLRLLAEIEVWFVPGGVRLRINPSSLSFPDDGAREAFKAQIARFFSRREFFGGGIRDEVKAFYIATNTEMPDDQFVAWADESVLDAKTANELNGLLARALLR